MSHDVLAALRRHTEHYWNCPLPENECKRCRVAIEDCLEFVTELVNRGTGTATAEENKS